MSPVVVPFNAPLTMTCPAHPSHNHPINTTNNVTRGVISLSSFTPPTHTGLLLWSPSMYRTQIPKQLKQNRRTEGCSKLKSLKTRQVQERFVSRLEHSQFPKWDRARCQSTLLPGEWFLCQAKHLRPTHVRCCGSPSMLGPTIPNQPINLQLYPGNDFAVEHNTSYPHMSAVVVRFNAPPNHPKPTNQSTVLPEERFRCRA